MFNSRIISALAITAGLGLGVVANAAPAHAAGADLDKFSLVVGGVSLKATMNWSHVVYQHADRDLGEFHPTLIDNTSGRCATITIDWFDGTDPANPQLAISNMTMPIGCSTPSADSLNLFNMSRFNEPAAIKAVVCLKVAASGVLPAVSKCTTSNPFTDNVLTGI